MKLNGPDKGPITQLKTYHTTRDLRPNSGPGPMTQLRKWEYDPVTQLESYVWFDRFS